MGYHMTSHMTDLAGAEAPPAGIGADAHAAMADFHRGCVRHFKGLDVVSERLRGLGGDLPGSGGGAILGTVHRLTC